MAVVPCGALAAGERAAVRAVIAGATSGMVMACVFTPAFALVLFEMIREGSPRLRALLTRLSPFAVVMPVVVLAYPVWGIVGAVMGILYATSVESAPGGGMGSSNMVYTLSVAGVAALVAAPAALVFRRFVAVVAVLGLSFAGIFGWFLPLFAA